MERIPEMLHERELAAKGLVTELKTLAAPPLTPSEGTSNSSGNRRRPR